MLSVEQCRQILNEESLPDVEYTLEEAEWLRSVLYAGKILIPAWRDEPEEIVEGLHEALVSEHTFRRVQERVDAPLGTRRKHKLREELILRGHLLCPACLELMTGSTSRGRSKTYAYYHCHHCTQARYRADEVNARFPGYLSAVEVGREVQALYQRALQDLTQNEEMLRRRRLTEIKRQIEQHEEKLFRTDEAYIDGKISADSYERLKAEYADRLQAARMQRIDLEEAGEGFGEKLRFALSLLSNLGKVYQEANLEGKNEMLVRIFPDHLIYRDGSF